MQILYKNFTFKTILSLFYLSSPLYGASAGAGGMRPQYGNILFTPQGMPTDALKRLLRIACPAYRDGDTIEEINTKIQDAKWISKPGTERLKMELSSALATATPDVIESIITTCLEGLNMAPAVYPLPSANFDGALILGTTFKGMVGRCRFYNQLVAEGKLPENLKAYVLTGERKASVELFGETKEEFEKFATTCKGEPVILRDEEIPQNEFEMMKFILKYQPLSAASVDYIYSEKDPSHTRATTDSTMVAFLEKVKEGGNFIAISNQPFIEYQQAILTLRHLKQGRHDINIYTAGYDITEEVRLAPDRKNRAAILLDTVGKTIKSYAEVRQLDKASS